MAAISQSIQRYLSRHAERYPEQDQLGTPSDGLRLCIVIPATGERERIQPVLRSLEAGSSRLFHAEVIVVVNNSRDASEERLSENLATIQDLKSYPGTLPILVLDRASRAKAHPASVAGVGAARRCGMDLALRRLVQAGHTEEGAIACLDADSPVTPGYVDALLSVFDVPNPPLAGICQYQHPLPENELHARSLLAYELWLRYLELGMRVSNSPYAYQAIGSCLVVSALGYALADGMPRRKAGEDFYFLQKLVKISGERHIQPIHEAMVFPSPRVSDRVPFGTGYAMQRCKQEGAELYLYVEPPQAFRDFRNFYKGLPECYYRPGRLHDILSPDLHTFIESKQAFTVLDRLLANASSSKQYVRSVQNWFGSLQLVRFARACKHIQGGVWLFYALEQVLIELGMGSILESLPGCQEGACGFTIQLEWLKAIRNLQEKSCLQTGQGGMKPS